MRTLGIYALIALLILSFGCRGESVGQKTTPVLENTNSAMAAPDQNTRNRHIEKNTPPATRVITTRASWPIAHEFAGLMLHSDLIIEGTVEDIIGSRTDEPEYPTITTDYSVKINRVLKSYPGFEKDSIVVSQWGGTWNGITQIFEDDEPYQVGEQVLLFLREGETAYSAMIPGGRFKINADGILESPIKHLGLDIVENYHGKPKVELEEAILNSLPDETDYLGMLYPAFLIAEGIVSDAGTRLQEGEDTQLVYTVYSFRVQRVLHDELKLTQTYSFKPEKYQKTPIKKGDIITIFELGGTYGDIARTRVSPLIMSSGSKLLLFLGGFACSERPGLCTPEEQDSGYAMYTANDPGRFMIDSDKNLKSLATRGWIKRFYGGQKQTKLEKDLVQVKEKWQAKQDAIKDTPDTTSQESPPPIPTQQSTP